MAMTMSAMNATMRSDVQAPARGREAAPRSRSGDARAMRPPARVAIERHERRGRRFLLVLAPRWSGQASQRGQALVEAGARETEHLCRGLQRRLLGKCRRFQATSACPGDENVAKQFAFGFV